MELAVMATLSRIPRPLGGLAELDLAGLDLAALDQLLFASSMCPVPE
jgi:hypothetical protein